MIQKIIETNIQKLRKRFEELNNLICSDAKLHKSYIIEHATISQILQKYDEYQQINKKVSEIDKLLTDTVEPEFRQLAQEELNQLSAKKHMLYDTIKRYFTTEKNEIKSVILEIRAATGGQEAALFAADLSRMYMRYAAKQNWFVELLSSHPTKLGGFKEIIFSITGNNAYKFLQYEGGVHRVQRIPVTETSGRIHTSTATVTVLVEPDEIDTYINPNEIRIDTYGASGHGGQHLQKTASAVRITHLPTGIVVQCQDERSQIRNREKAKKLLAAKLYALKRKQQEDSIAKKRREQIGSGERAEKIRTYNFPQNRLTDHRINFSVYDLKNIMDGNLDVVVEQLQSKLHEQQDQ